MEMQEKTIAEITVQANYKTFHRYFVYSNRKRLMPWLSWALMFVAAPAYEIFLTVKYITAGKPFPLLLWVLLAVNVLGAAYLLLEPRLAYRRHAGKQKAAQRCYAFKEDCVISWDADAPADAPKDKEVLAYDAVQLAGETRTAFYLHMQEAGETCLALPKSCMTPEQTVALQKLFAEKLGEKFKGRKK